MSRSHKSTSVFLFLLFFCWFCFVVPWNFAREGFPQIPSEYPPNPPKSFPRKFSRIWPVQGREWEWDQGECSDQEVRTEVRWGQMKRVSKLLTPKSLPKYPQHTSQTPPNILQIPNLSTPQNTSILEKNPAEFWVVYSFSFHFSIVFLNKHVSTIFIGTG